MCKVISEETKCTVFKILCKCNFYSVDLIGGLEVLVNILRFHRGGIVEDFMMTDERLQGGTVLVNEGTLFLGVGESISTSSIEVDCDRGVFGTFLFYLENLDRFCSKIRIIIFNGYHIYVTTGIHRKLVRYGGC